MLACSRDLSRSTGGPVRADTRKHRAMLSSPADASADTTGVPAVEDDAVADATLQPSSMTQEFIRMRAESELGQVPVVCQCTLTGRSALPGRFPLELLLQYLCACNHIHFFGKACQWPRVSCRTQRI